MSYLDWRDGGSDIAAYIMWQEGISACFWPTSGGFGAWAFWPDGRQSNVVHFDAMPAAILWCEEQVVALLDRRDNKARPAA